MGLWGDEESRSRTSRQRQSKWEEYYDFAKIASLQVFYTVFFAVTEKSLIFAPKFVYVHCALAKSRKQTASILPSYRHNIYSNSLAVYNGLGRPSWHCLGVLYRLLIACCSACGMHAGFD